MHEAASRQFPDDGPGLVATRRAVSALYRRRHVVCSGLHEAASRQRFDLPYDKLPTRLGLDHHIFPNILDEVGLHLACGQKLVIVIDALDEADPQPHSEGINALYLPSSLPPGIFFVVSSRPRRHQDMPLRTISPEQRLSLEEQIEENRADVEEYIQQQMRRFELESRIQESGLSTGDFTKILAERSENNFMYLFYVLRSIYDRTYDMRRHEEIPQGLAGYYEDHWSLMERQAGGEETKTRALVLYYLCELRRPVTRTGLADYTGASEASIQATLGAWDQFLLVRESTEGRKYSLYHASFRDFLHREKMLEANAISIAEVNRSIAGRTLSLLGIKRRATWAR